MDSEFCFSTISILRCGFSNTSRLEVILLMIPTAIEVLFATSLIFANWGNGRRHLWITAEGWIYFSLALIEMLSYLLPAVRVHLDGKVFDTVLAAASSVPIFCYLFFVFLFARAELIDILPRRFQMISKLMLLIFIPAIVTLNELASFIGVSRRAMNPPVIADVFVRTFFTSLTLALLVAYQVMTFCLAFYRLIKAILNQRRIEATASDEAQSLRGTGWITVGLKFGAIETVIGFAANNFGSAMTRRIMRLLARASLIVGLIKGLDTTEDFTSLEEELDSVTRRQNLRRSRLRNSVSNPRHSTLRQLSPPVATFHSSPRSESGLPAPEKFAEVKESSNAGRRFMADKSVRERVTIQFENGTPRLHMRFSTLEIPEFPIPISNTNITRTATEVAKRPRQSAPRPATFHADSSDLSSPSNALGLYELMPRTGPDVAKGTLLKTAPDLRSSPRVYPPSSKEPPSESLYSTPTRSTVDSYTSLSTVRELASQFPSLPTRIPESIKQSVANRGTPVDFWDDSPSVISRASRGPTALPPRSPEYVTVPLMIGGEPTPKAITTTHYLDPTAPDSNVTTPTTTISGYTTTPALSMLTALTDEPYADFGSTKGSMKSRTFRRDSTGAVAPDRDPADWIDFNGIPGSNLPPVIEETGEGQTRHSRRSGSMESLRISWLQNPEEPQLVRAVNLKSQVARIKSIGKAPMRVTPRPVKNRHLRDSLHIEQIQIPPREDAYNLQIVQGSLGPSYDQSVLRDSDVLGMEDLNYPHNQHTND